MGALQTRDCRILRSGEWSGTTDKVAPETRITVEVSGREPRVLWAHPSDLERLAMGHAKIHLVQPGNEPRLQSAIGAHYLFEQQPSRAEPVQEPPRLKGDWAIGAMFKLLEGAGLWDATGCFHRASCWVPGSPDPEAVADDIGRHNCIDRLAGWAVENRVDLGGLALLTTARITGGYLEKALQAGFRLLVSRSAVTGAAVSLAAEHEACLCGFTRPDEARLTMFRGHQGGEP
jgi:FdhD protein